MVWSGIGYGEMRQGWELTDKSVTLVELLGSRPWCLWMLLATVTYTMVWDGWRNFALARALLCDLGFFNFLFSTLVSGWAWVCMLWSGLGCSFLNRKVLSFNVGLFWVQCIMDSFAFPLGGSIDCIYGSLHFALLCPVIIHEIGPQ